MGYWNGWENYGTWYAMNRNEGKKCAHCGGEFWPLSPRQKLCSREDSPACDDDRYFEDLWEKGKHPLQLLGFAEIENGNNAA
jgi:hypothetical protein